MRIPLSWSLSGGNRNDVTELIPLLDAVSACAAGSAGRARPERVTTDSGYGNDTHRCQFWQRWIKPEIVPRQTEPGSGLGRYRWIVEHTFV